jgi:hypothetical protein
MPKYTMKKYMGDDLYYWAVFRDGKPVVTGCARNEAKWHKAQLEKAESNESSAHPTR